MSQPEPDELPDEFIVEARRRWGCLDWFIVLGLGLVLTVTVGLALVAAVIGIANSSGSLKELLQGLLWLLSATVLVSLGGILVTRNNEVRRHGGTVPYSQRTRWRKAWWVIGMSSSTAALVVALTLAFLA